MHDKVLYDRIPLSEFLEAGADPRPLLRGKVYSLLEDVEDRARWTPAAQAKRSAEALAQADDMRAHGTGIPFIDERDPNEHLDYLVLLYEWRADILADPSLVDGLLKWASDDERSEYLRGVDNWRSCHPLVVDAPQEHWVCESCGTPDDGGTKVALHIGHREGFSDEPDRDGRLHFCANCVGLAAQAMNGANIEPFV